MIDDKEILERALLQFPPLPGIVERVHRRRQRQYRRRRVGTIGLALVIAVAAIVGLVRAFEGAERGLPANEPFTPENVGRLKLLWVGGHGPVLTPAVGGDTVFVTEQARSSRGLAAYPTTCKAAGCPWRGVFNLGKDASAPTWIDGKVYVSTYERHFGDSIKVFICGPAACEGAGGLLGWEGWPISQPVGSAGTIFFKGQYSLGAVPETCVYHVYYSGPMRCPGAWAAWPLRHGTVPPGTGPPVVADGTVYVANGRGPLWAYSVSCGERMCRPKWIGIPGLDVRSTGSPAISAGVMYVTTERGLFAIPEPCDSPVSCRPLWHWDTSARLDTPVVTGGMVYVSSATSGDVYALDARCGSADATCEPRWSIHVPEITQASPVVTDKVAFVEGISGRLYALPTSCESGRCGVLWASKDALVGAPLHGASPALGDGKVFVPEANGLSAYGLGSVPPPAPPVSDGMTTALYIALGIALGAAIGASVMVVGRRRRVLR